MLRSLIIKFIQISLLLLVLVGCNKKADTQFKIEDHFQKVANIPLTELESRPVNVYTEFGFYAVEQELSRISKYNNSGEYEFSFGKKGRGPGETEDCIPVSYDEEKGILGIYDFKNAKYCYYDKNGDFLNFETMEYAGRDFFINKMAGLKVHTYLSVKEEIGNYSMRKNIDINNKNILSVDYPKKERITAFPLKYSINDGIVYFSEYSNKKQSIYKYVIESDDLKTIELEKSGAAFEKGIYRFISYANYMIISCGDGKQYFFSLEGKYLGCINSDDEQIAFDGAYGEYIYLVNYVDSEMESIDIYKAK